MISKTKFIGLLAILPLVLTIVVASYANETSALKSEGTLLPQTGSANSPVCGDQLCSEVTTASMDDKNKQESTEVQYTYRQDFLPVKKIDLELEKTAIFITDPQNDFLSEGGAAWPLVGEEVIKDKVVEHQIALVAAAKEVGIPVFYSPHTYTEMDYANWTLLNPIDQIMFDIDMFHQGTWGHDFHPDLVPNDMTVVMNPHKGLSNFHAGDAKMQLRQYGIETLIMAGMSANLCVESHLRDAIENGFEVIVIADATAGAGPHAKNAALINFEFIANEVTVTDDIISRLLQAANS
jgi:nicotinamidase-related amidase